MYPVHGVVKGLSNIGQELPRRYMGHYCCQSTPRNYGYDSNVTIRLSENRSNSSATLLLVLLALIISNFVN